MLKKCRRKGVAENRKLSNLHCKSFLSGLSGVKHELKVSFFFIWQMKCSTADL